MTTHTMLHIILSYGFSDDVFLRKIQAREFVKK